MTDIAMIKGKTTSNKLIIWLALFAFVGIILTISWGTISAQMAEGIFWRPELAFAAVAIVFALGEALSVLTKGRVSFIIFASLIFLVLFWNNILPGDITNRTNIPPMIGTIGIALMIVNLGTMIELGEIVREWRTVLIAVSGIVGILIVALTIGTMLFGRDMALTAAPPISGGMVAALLVQQAAMVAGRPEIAGFAILVYASQKFIGLPLATWCVNKDLKSKMDQGDFDHDSEVHLKAAQNKAIEPLLPKKFSGQFITFGILAAVAASAYLFSQMTIIPGAGPTMYIIHPVISYLGFGLIATRIGLLPKKTLTKTMSKGFILYAALFLLPGSLAKISPVEFLNMLPAIFGMLILAAIGISVMGIITGRFFKYSPYLSVACSITCMLGYPVTEIMTNECVGNLEGATPEQKERASAYMLPKIVIAGFATVTIASVIFAALVAPIIFG